MTPTDTKQDDLVARVEALTDQRRMMLLTMIHKQYKIIVCDPHYKTAIVAIKGFEDVQRIGADVEGDLFRGDIPRLAGTYERWVTRLKEYGLEFPGAYELMNPDDNVAVPVRSG